MVDRTPKHNPPQAPIVGAEGLRPLPEPAMLVTAANLATAKELVRLCDPDQSCCTPVFGVHGNGIEAVGVALEKGAIPGTVRQHAKVTPGALFFCKLAEASSAQRAAAIQETMGYAQDIAQRNATIATLNLSHTDADLKLAGKIVLTCTTGFSELGEGEQAVCARRNINPDTIATAALRQRQGCLIFLKPSVEALEIVPGDYPEPGPGTQDVADFALRVGARGLTINHIASIVLLGNPEKEWVQKLALAVQHLESKM